jgi:hypothetical protein
MGKKGLIIFFLEKRMNEKYSDNGLNFLKIIIILNYALSNKILILYAKSFN